MTPPSLVSPANRFSRFVCDRQSVGRFIRAAAFGAFVSAGVNAAPLAYEGFNYTAGTPLAGQTGPLGFSGAYTASNSGLNVSSGGSTYGDLSVVGNKLAFTGSNNNGNFGVLSNSPETPGTSVYFSYLMQASPTGGYAGVSLFNGENDEVLFTGKRNGPTYLFGMEPKVGDSGNTPVPCTRLSFVVCRIDFAADSAVIRMYVNPQTADEPAAADLTVTRTTALIYDRVRFQSHDVTGSVDEFRMGDSYADVAPMTYGSIPSEIVVLGSSVAAGVGASPQETNGWAWRLKTLLETPPPVVPGSLVAWNVHNASVSGNNTTAVINRFQNDVAIPRAGADIVMISLSLANEGLINASNPQAVFDSFKNGVEDLIELCRAADMDPVVTLCYPQNLYDAEEYSYVRRMNLLLNTWDVPSVNFLGAIDDGSGHWAPGHAQDDGHPNSQGHLEMYASVVPSLFDAIVAGKTSPAWGGTTGYLRLQQDLANPSPLSYTPAQEYRSLTLSFRVRTTGTGTVAAIESGGTGATMEIRSNALVHVSPTGVETSIPATLADGRWHDLALSHRKPTNQTLVFIDGQLQATVAGALTTGTFSVGGPGAIAGRASSPIQADYQDVAIYRAAWTQDEALAQSRGALQQASLDILATLDDASPTQGAPLANRAQSFSSLNLLTGNFTASVAPTTPGNLSAASYESGTASLLWTDNASGSATFTIERRRTGIAEPWMIAGTSPGGQPFFEDSGLLSGTSYDYRVSVAEGPLQGDYSNVASVTPAGQEATSYDSWIAGFYPPPQDEAIYLVDFNTTASPNYNGALWNTVSSASNPTPLALHDSDGNTAGITVAISDSFDQTRTDAGSVLTDYPATAQGTLFALRDENPLAGAITFAGLDPAAVYDFSFFARRGALVGGFDYSGTYTFTGGGSPVAVTVDAATNTLMTRVPGIAPNGSGVITLTITPGPGTGTDFPVINFLKFQKGRPGTHLVDFNTTASPDYGATGWNTVNSPSSATPYALLDMYGANHGVGLTLTNGFDQTRTDGGSPMSDFPATAQTTLFALRDDNPLTASMTFSGLNPAIAYDISFFSRRGSLVGGFDYTGTFTFTGAGAPVVVVSDAAVNTSLTEVPPVTPDASGNITLAISAGPGSGTDFPVINFIRFAPPVDAGNHASLIDPDADPDDDGFSNFEEYARGFDPTVADGSPLQLKAFTVDSSTVSRLQITRLRSASEADYILESSSDLVFWSEYLSATRSVIAFDGTTETLLFEAPPSGPKRFFRLALVGQP